jgi:CubicO group peptidase (beta-lactamase class C family)
LLWISTRRRRGAGLLGRDAEPATQPHHEVLEVVGRRLSEEQPLSRPGVHKPQSLGVQRDAADRERIARRLAVHLVPQHGVAEVGQVDSNLVRPSGPELRLDQRKRAEAFERAENRTSGSAPASGRERRAAGAGAWPADCAVHETLVGQLTANDGDVLAADAMSAKLSLQAFRGVVRQREDEKARGVAIEAVYDEDAPVTPSATLDLGAGPAHNGVLIAFGRGVHEQTGGLVDNQDVGIGVDDLDGWHLGSACPLRQAGVVRHDVGWHDERSGIGRYDPVHEDMAHQDLLLGPGIRGAEDRLSNPGEPSHRSVHDRSVALRRRPGGQRRVFRGRVTGMDREESGADQVAALLGRAGQSGLAVGRIGLAVRGGGRGRCWCSGVAELQGAPVVADLQFDLASLTKPLATATLLLMARRDGLELEAPISETLPELAGSPWQDVTFLQCATHTGGFPAWAPLYALGPATREGYLESLRGIRPGTPPGVRVEYSCLGFIATAIALERASGADLRTLFRELIAEPLGIAQELGFAPSVGTGVAGGETNWFVETRLLTDRRLDGAPPPAVLGVVPCDDGNARALGGSAGNAGLFGSAAAVARLAGEYLPGGGDVLSSEEAELATNCFTRGLQQARGLGWQLAASPGCSAGPALSQRAFGHTGFTGTSVWADPEDGRVFVLLANRLHPGGRTCDLHPLRRRFHELAARALDVSDGRGAGV